MIALKTYSFCKQNDGISSIKKSAQTQILSGNLFQEAHRVQETSSTEAFVTNGDLFSVGALQQHVILKTKYI